MKLCKRSEDARPVAAHYFARQSCSWHAISPSAGQSPLRRAWPCRPPGRVMVQRPLTFLDDNRRSIVLAITSRSNPSLMSESPF